MIKIRRLPIQIRPSSKRMLVRPFTPSSEAHLEHILFRIFSTPAEEQKKVLSSIYERLTIPKEMIKKVFYKHFEIVKKKIPSNIDIPDEQKQLIGSYFTLQYSLESTALFNPSIVLHPVQDKKDVVKFIMSLRAIGEGHISSITFMDGEIDKNFNVTLTENSPIICEPERKEHEYQKNLFIKKSNELGILSDINRLVFENLSDRFTLTDLEKSIAKIRSAYVHNNKSELEHAMNSIRLLALSNFTLNFSTETISERAIYPSSPSQSNGLEDARFVRFVEDDGRITYFATFTAYDGKTIMPEMLETTDFKEFNVSTLNGASVKNKGMALFPRKVNGSYMMIGRQDNESLFIMKADNPYFWHDQTQLIKPTESWELIQIGNCGSPIEIEEGWLVITHGVGPVRTYSLGAILLDKDDPSRVIGRLEKPLIEPGKDESYGYVPNVVYTCGAMIIDRTLILPYAIGDVVTTFAVIEVDGLVKEMKRL